EEFLRRGVEHVHVHFANQATYTALFIKELVGIPFSFTAHAQDFMVDLGNDDLLREMCREAEFVVAVSDWSRDLLAKTCPDSASKMQRIYNGIRLDDFPTAQTDSPGPLKIVAIGRLIEFKGFQYLLESCALMRDRGIDFDCTIIGEGPWQERLLDQRENLGLADLVTFAGIRTQEEVKRQLEESHVFVLPCIVDSKGASDILPTVIMEAMAAQLPIVSTWLVGVPEMVEDQKTGLLVESANPGELANALGKLAEEPELRKELGEAGCMLAAERFDRTVTTKQLLNLFPSSEPQPSWTADTRVLYLVDEWPSPDETLSLELDYLLDHQPAVRMIACESLPKAIQLSHEERKLFLSDKPMEFLPDGMILEANWRHHPEDVERIIRLRQKLGNAISSEQYFISARRALHLAELMKKRRIPHLHAARSSTAVTAWIVFKLGAVDRFSFASERDSVLHPKVLDRLEKDACLVSRADGEDLLHLAGPEYHRLEVGPLKMRLWPESQPDRREFLNVWAKRLLEE
ncbi:MAG: glycosyltransferase family 4 protein, partial [Verrucomicrobiota bacterium]